MSNAGPFVSSNLNESFLLLLTFVISVSVPSLALSADVAVRRRHEEHVSFVMRELSHRSKNLLSIVQSMATQVARQTDSFDDFCVGFSRRLSAFAETSRSPRHGRLARRTYSRPYPNPPSPIPQFG
jgi:HWE histidine kinase